MSEYVLTIMAHPAEAALTDARVEEIAGKMVGARKQWRVAGAACDLYFNPADGLHLPTLEEIERVAANTLLSVMDAVAAATGSGGGFSAYDMPADNHEKTLAAHASAKAVMLAEQAGLDVLMQPSATRRKKLLICDMDSTMITVECIDELADFVGKKAEVSRITERAMNGELDFAAALTERVRLLEGLPEETLQRCYDERVAMMPGAKALVRGMRAAGAYCVLVSGGFTFFTARVAAELGFHEHHANVLEVRDGALTGAVTQPVLGKEAKLETLHHACQKLGITPQDAVAVGDGANDLPMLLAAGLGIAYHARPMVQAQAKHRINHCDLRAVLWAQGMA